MPGLTKEITDKEVLTNLQRKAIARVVGRTYLLSQKGLNENPELKGIFDETCQSIFERVTAGKEIDEEKMQKNFDRLNDERRKNQRYGDGRLIGFRDRSTQIIYTQLNNLSKMLTEHEFKSVADGIVAAHNMMYKEGEKDAEIEQ